MQQFLDLKICEGCGSLWYRATGVLKVYCAPCAVKLAEFPAPRARARPGGRRRTAVVANFGAPAGGLR